MKETVSSVNTRVGNRHILGGSEDTVSPFEIDPDTGDATYVGAHDARDVEIGPGVTQQASVRATQTALQASYAAKAQAFRPSILDCLK